MQNNARPTLLVSSLLLLFPLLLSACLGQHQVYTVLRDVSMLSAQQGWAVGDQAKIVAYDGQQKSVF